MSGCVEREGRGGGVWRGRWVEEVLPEMVALGAVSLST